MATYAFDIYPANDPAGKISTSLVGARLVRLTIDGEMVSGWYKHAGHGLGEGSISIHTDHADATEANFAKRNYVMFVRTDVPEDIGGFFLEEGDFNALSRDERGGRILTYSGPGGLAYLDRYVLGHSVYATGQDFRGDFNIPDQWTWQEEPYGAMLLRAIEEGRDHPDAFFAALSTDFTRTRDSNDLLWDELADYQTPIGTSVLELYGDFLRLGLIAQCSAFLELTAYRDIDEFRTDRTSATFAAGKARFEAGVNLINEMPRRLAARQDRTHVLIRDRIGEYQTVDADLNGNPLGTEPYMAFLKSDTTADNDAILKMGKIHLTRRKNYSDQAVVQHIIGAGTGQYAPGPSGDYWVLDLVTLHTGSAQHDFDETPIEVASIRYYHDEAGNWFAEAELGAQYIPSSIERFESSITSSIRNVRGLQLCAPVTTVVPVGISRIGFTTNTGSGGGMTVPLPSHTVGDLIVVHGAYEGSGPHIPAPPTGWTAIGSGGTAGGAVSGIGQRGAYKIAQSSTEVSGTWTNALSLIAVVYRGVDQADPIGHINGDDNASGELGWAALTLERTDSTSWAVAFGKHKTDSLSGDTMNGTAAMTFRTVSADTGHGFWDSGAGITTWGRHYVTTTNDDRLATAYEIRGGSAQTFTGDGHADMVGTGSKAARCDHTHHVFRTSAPTTGDDEDDGYVAGTAWFHVNSLPSPTSVTTKYVLLDATAGAAVWVAEGGGAPTNADYLVGTANGSLSNEIVVGTSPGGELGGTWASPTVDATHSGSSHAGVIATHEAAGDPHTGYRLESADHSHASSGLQGGTIAHSALTGLTVGDPHTQYQQESEKGAASGYASLDGSTKVPFAQLPTGTGAAEVAIGNHSHAGGAHTHVYSEVPTGTVNGVNDDFVLAATPTSGTLRVYKNGLRQKAGAGNDYTLSADTITFEAGNIPQTGDSLLADYET